MADQAAVAEAVNDMLKAISASLLMEQVLAPRYEFTPKDTGRKRVSLTVARAINQVAAQPGVNETTGQFMSRSTG
jgi:hypothetical protein